MDSRDWTAEDVETLTLTLLGEARGEGPIGMLAVGNVIRSRADSAFYPNDPVRVVRQPRHFSAWDDGQVEAARREAPPSSALYRQAERIVRQAILAPTPTLPNVTGGAVNYHASNITPYWSSGATTRWGTVNIGRQTFYARRPVPPVSIPEIASLLDVNYVPPSPMRTMGQTEPGNLALTARPIVRNPDGSVHTLLSMSFEEDGREVLVPRVSLDGRVMSPDEAVDEYRRTGKHLGKFTSPEAATRFADQIHIGQDRMFGPRNFQMPRRDPRKAGKSPGRLIAEMQQEQREQAHRRSFAEFAFGDDAMAQSGDPERRSRRPLSELERAKVRARQELIRRLSEPKVKFELDAFADMPDTRVAAPSRTVAPGAGLSRVQQEAMREVRSAAATRLRTVTIEFERNGDRRAASVPQGTAAPVPQGTAAGVPQRTIIATEPRPERQRGRPAMETPSRVTEEGLNVYTRKLYTVDANGNPIIVDAPVAQPITRTMREPRNPPAARLASIRAAAAAAARTAGKRRAAIEALGPGGRSPAFPSPSDPTYPEGHIIRKRDASRLFEAPNLPIRPDLQEPSTLSPVPDQIAEIIRNRTASAADFVPAAAPVPAIPSAALVRQRTRRAPQPAPRFRRVTPIGTAPKMSDLVKFRSVPFGGRSSREMLEGTEYEKLGGDLDEHFKSPSAPRPAPAAQRPAPKVSTQTVAPQPRTIPKTIRVRNPEFGKAIIAPVSADQTVILDRFGIPTGEIGVRNAPPGPRTRPNVPEFIDQIINVPNPNFVEITVPGGRPMPAVVAPRPAAISRRPSVAIRPRSSGVYFAPPAGNTIHSNPTKYGATSDERKASARRRQRLENFGGGEGSGPSGVPQSLV